jgi:hypothetical protein
MVLLALAACLLGPISADNQLMGILVLLSNDVAAYLLGSVSAAKSFTIYLEAIRRQR